MMFRRTLVVALEIVGGIVAGAAVLLGLFFWRLSQGPISLDVLEPLLRAEMERQGDGQGVRVRVGELELTWEGLSSPLEIRARRLTADASDAANTTNNSRFVMTRLNGQWNQRFSADNRFEFKFGLGESHFKNRFNPLRCYFYFWWR
jgi:hypothetical protein